MVLVDVVVVVMVDVVVVVMVVVDVDVVAMVDVDVVMVVVVLTRNPSFATESSAECRRSGAPNPNPGLNSTRAARVSVIRSRGGPTPKSARISIQPNKN